MLLRGDDLIDIFGLGGFFDPRGSKIGFVGVALLVEGCLESMKAFLEGDPVGIEKGIETGMYDLVVLVLLFLIEGGQLGLVVDEFLGMEFIIFLILFDAVHEVGEIKVLFFEPINDLDVIVGIVVSLVFL